ncbi:hypothetical protein [Acetobacter pasteurianus]|nr:hypothetical protein [Acetobacter pasteurianus]
MPGNQIFSPFGSRLLPHVVTPQAVNLEGSFISKECAAMSKAIALRIALHPELIRLLDQAIITGKPALWANLAPYMPYTNHPDICTLPKTWDRTIDGYSLSMPEECVWTTLRDWYGWGIPCAETLDVLKNKLALTKILEFGQGTGYMARVLEAAGLNVITAECFNRGYDGIGVWRLPDYNDAREMIQKNPGAPILISWPDPEASAEIISMLAPGQKVIIGGRRAYCGLQDGYLLANGFTRLYPHTYPNSLASMSGGLSGLSLWKAPA